MKVFFFLLQFGLQWSYLGYFYIIKFVLSRQRQNFFEYSEFVFWSIIFAKSKKSFRLFSRDLERDDLRNRGKKSGDTVPLSIGFWACELIYLYPTWCFQVMDNMYRMPWAGIRGRRWLIYRARYCPGPDYTIQILEIFPQGEIV